MIKQLHEADLQELRSRTISTDLDPSQFFRNELAQAIKDIRGDYETITENQRTDLQNRFQIIYNECVMQMRRPGPDLGNIKQREQEEKLRKSLLNLKNEMGYMKAKNEDLKNSIAELKKVIDQERDDGSRRDARRAQDIEEMRRLLEQLQREYDQVTNLKTSLEKEIGVYRDLLEGRDGLRELANRVLESAQQSSGGDAGTYFSPTRGAGGSTTISRTSVVTTGYGYGAGGGGGGVGSLVSQPARTSNIYQTLTGGFGSTLGASPRSGGGGVGSSYSSSTSAYQNRQSQQYSP